MQAIERIQQYIERLPQPLQAEVLDFVEFLLSRVERESEEREEAGWSDLSLAYAMRGMEGEDAPLYTTADLRVVFQ